VESRLRFAGSYGLSRTTPTRSGDTVSSQAIVYDRLRMIVHPKRLSVVLDKPYDPAKRSADSTPRSCSAQNATVIKSGGGHSTSAPRPISPPSSHAEPPTPNGSGVQFKAGRMPTLLVWR